MKKTITITFLLFLATCTPSIISSVQNTVISNNSKRILKIDSLNITVKNSDPFSDPIYIYKKESLELAIRIFASEYENQFDLQENSLISILSGLTIEVGVLPKNIKAAYDIRGNLVENVPVSGLALDKDTIWVEIRTSLICHSSLLHELVHIIIWRNQIHHADPDHEGTEFSGWSKSHTDLIKRVNLDLCSMGI